MNGQGEDAEGGVDNNKQRLQDSKKVQSPKETAGKISRPANGQVQQASASEPANESTKQGSNQASTTASSNYISIRSHCFEPPSSNASADIPQRATEEVIQRRKIRNPKGARKGGKAQSNAQIASETNSLDRLASQQTQSSLHLSNGDSVSQGPSAFGTTKQQHTPDPVPPPSTAGPNKHSDNTMSDSDDDPGAELEEDLNGSGKTKAAALKPSPVPAKWQRPGAPSGGAATGDTSSLFSRATLPGLSNFNPATPGIAQPSTSLSSTGLAPPRAPSTAPSAPPTTSPQPAVPGPGEIVCECCGKIAKSSPGGTRCAPCRFNPQPRKR